MFVDAHSNDRCSATDPKSIMIDGLPNGLVTRTFAPSDLTVGGNCLTGT
jgi:hypothetical protein